MSSAAAQYEAGILPLIRGERLTRGEFERRFDGLTGPIRAELIEGVVRLRPPVRWHNGACPTADVIGWLGCYAAATRGTDVGAHPSVRLDAMNEPQPTAAMILSAGVGGQTRVSPDGFLEGGPELVAEVAAETDSIDLQTGFRVYGRNNVRECILWSLRDAAIDWFVLRNDRYNPLPLGTDGAYRSETFSGLWLNAAALVRNDIPAVLQTLQQGLGSPEHAAFISQLQSRSANHRKP